MENKTKGSFNEIEIKQSIDLLKTLMHPELFNSIFTKNEKGMEIKKKLIMQFINNCNIKLDNTDQQIHTFNEAQMSSFIDDIMKLIMGQATKMK